MKESIEIYCDGGCRGNNSKENIGAWGVYMSYKGKEKEIGAGVRNTTNNQMELTACIQALSTLKTEHIPVNIYVDSAYVLNGITKWIYSWEKNGWRTSKKQPVENKELWVQLQALKNNQMEVNFIKVKGHSGNDGNERADRICNDYMDKLATEDDEEWLKNKGWA